MEEEEGRRPFVDADNENGRQHQHTRKVSPHWSVIVILWKEVWSCGGKEVIVKKERRKERRREKKGMKYRETVLHSGTSAKRLER